MTKTTRTADTDRLIETLSDDVQAILHILHLDLHDESGDLQAECEWHCGAEDRWWPIEARHLQLTELYAVRWTVTDEAGVADVEIAEIVDDESDAVALQTWLEAIAADCGSCDGQVR